MNRRHRRHHRSDKAREKAEEKATTAEPEPTPDPEPTPTSDLWDLVLDLDWPRVTEHASKHPPDSRFVEGHWHETPLYLACQHHPPLEAVEAIVDACPSSVKIASREHGDLPLHIACRYGASAELLEALLRHHPETATESTKWGRKPLETLWEFREPGEENGDGDGGDDGDDGDGDDDNAVDSVWGKVLVLLGAIARVHHNGVSHPYSHLHPENDDSGMLRGSSQEDSDSSSDSNSDPNSESRSQLQSQSQPQTQPCLFVHAAASLGAGGCPGEVLDRLLEDYPEQLVLRDRLGNLPLHVAIRCAGTRTRTRTRRHNRRHRGGPPQTAISASVPVRRLLEACGDAARCRCRCDCDVDVRADARADGRFPIHEAIAYGHSWSGGDGGGVVEDLFRAAPELAETPDPITGLLPFALAAARTPSRDGNGNSNGNGNGNSNSNSNLEGIETTYRLLRARPDLLLRGSVERRTHGKGLSSSRSSPSPSPSSSSRDPLGRRLQTPNHLLRWRRPEWVTFVAERGWWPESTRATAAATVATVATLVGRFVRELIDAFVWGGVTLWQTKTKTTTTTWCFREKRHRPQSLPSNRKTTSARNP